VNAERTVSIAEFNAKAVVKAAEGEAQSKTINASADATVLRTVGDATAAKTLAVGTADAEVIKLKVASMDQANYAAVQIAQALATSGNKLVPDIVAGGSDSSGGIVSVLIARMLSDSIAKKAT
jgi:regulator of protease activity HflC (stomatin/prohibitin superfamily)